MIAALDDDGRRLDRLLRKALPDLPLSMLHRLLRQGRVLVDGSPAAASARVMAGSAVTITGDLALGFKETRLDSIPPKRTCPTPLSPYILWEGAGLLILNKPAGLAAHGPESLETLVRAYLAGRLRPSLSFRPGPLHRLDKPASGIIVFSTGLEGARYFSALMRERRIKKQYLALVDGNLEASAFWEDTLIRDRKIRKTFISRNGKENALRAETLVFPLAASASYSLIKAEIHTGRTHQIRAHAAFHGHPLSGDKKYGGSFQPHGLFLHAYTLEFPENPRTELPLRLQAPLPDGFRRKIRDLFGEIVDRENRC
jgi:23S rRNA pseudouridine955/2504/2580 synthase